MFGHNNDDQQPQNQPAQQDDQTSQGLAEETVNETIHPHDGAPLDAPAPQIDSTPAVSAVPIPSDTTGFQNPAEPISDVSASQGGSAVSAPAYQPLASDPHSDDAPVAGDDLAGIRQKALGDLSPLIEHLDHQTPEEKFQVTMMMVQANDDQSLLKTAYEAAQSPRSGFTGRYPRDQLLHPALGRVAELHHAAHGAAHVGATGFLFFGNIDYQSAHGHGRAGD
jgi:hypothetical protein